MVAFQESLSVPACVDSDVQPLLGDTRVVRGRAS